MRVFSFVAKLMGRTQVRGIQSGGEKSKINHICVKKIYVESAESQKRHKNVEKIGG